MSGISPRYVMNRFSGLVAQQSEGCVTPMALLKALWAGVGEHIALATGDRARYARLLQDAVKQYDLLALREVQRASVEGFQEKSARLFELYWAAVQAYCQDGEESAVDERAMRRIEVALGVPERTRERFRQEVFHTLSAVQAQGQSVDEATVPQVREGIERVVFSPLKDVERSLTAAGEEEGGRKAAIRQRLVQEYGYCDACAGDLLEYVGFILGGNQALRVTRAHPVRWHWDV